MGDYFSEYSSFIGAKGLPSPADTPYETPSFIRSKRSSRATVGSSREQSNSPPPLPPDATDVAEKSRDGRYSALDPRRFTPTLHASLVSEILNLRRELDSKNSLVENLETSLHTAKTENESLSEKLSENAKEVRKAKQQVAQIEQGTFSAVEDLAKERDEAVSGMEDLKIKLESAQKTARRQDEDAERTQRIWESEKESWDNERRQMERRIHVTESRLRTFVDEMSAQQAAVEAQQAPQEETEDSVFKDSGFGNESDAGSIRSMTPKKHRRNVSSLSYRRSLRNSTSTRSIGTPEPHARPGNSLADELGIDEEDEYDLDEFEHADEDLDYNEHLRRTMESRQSSVVDGDAKAKRILGIAPDSTDSPLTSPTMRDMPKRSDEVTLGSEPSKPSLEQPTLLPTVSEHIQTPKVQYVDSGYQPSPPPSPPQTRPASEEMVIPKIEEPEEEKTADPQRLRIETSGAAKVAAPVSPPATPSVDSETWSEKKRDSVIKPVYTSIATQTDFKEEKERPKSTATNRDSLTPPSFVPSIAIHPPTSRPSSPRPAVLPPGTKNASTQANLTSTNTRDASMQTEGIRVDKRPVKAASPQIPSPSNLLPSPTFEEPPPPPKSSKRAPAGGSAIIFQKPNAAPPLPSPPLRSARETREKGVDVPRSSSEKDLRSMPLRAIPLPRPVLAPTQSESEGPLNRSASYGVTQSSKRSSQLLDVDKDTDTSENEEEGDVFEDLAGTIPAYARPPHGRFGLSEPPKVVPEDKEISPERRPDTAGSFGACPAPSVASSRAGSQRKQHAKPPAKLNAYKDFRSRSPSFGSVASSAYSSQSAAPPFPIPHRSSSRVHPSAHSEGSRSPTQAHHSDVFGNRGSRGHWPQHSRQGSLRKVQSAAVIRHPARRASPTKSRRRRRHSPDLTPVQSMAFESPAPTKFPIPELPTPLQDSLQFDYVKGSMDIGGAPTVASSRRPSEETNLVDSIAGTMVGEWMWKYIRKRKSFGVQEDFPIAEDGSVNTSQHGTRHKRWVWLSPYERTVMWDNKQPTTGNALLGKKGRKLAIQSVLDVPDETPLPKDRELTSAFNRSILILTPQRALKFTAVSEERHALWMTALSFLAQSGRLPSQIPSAPPAVQKTQPPPVPALPAEGAQGAAKRHRSPSFGRATVRDSIRIAKGKRPDFRPAHSNPDHHHHQPRTNPNAPSSPAEPPGADFPAVPRLYSSTTRHQRKRSNTSPRLPQPLNGAFRSFSSHAGVPSTSTSSGYTAGGSENNTNRLAAGTFSRPSASSKSGSGASASARGSSLASPDRPNFFEAVGTVRMEAFVDPNVRDGVLYVPGPPAGGMGGMGIAGGTGAARSRPSGRGRGDSNFSQSTNDKRRAGYVFDEDGMDPFKNF